jgi:hypothetical protein
MTTTHTPGPWRFDAPRGAIVTSAGDSVAVVCFHGADSMAQEDANGRLIAQAPELLRVARLALAELSWLKPCTIHPASGTIRALQDVIDAAAQGSAA